jgi:hypothetical protein
MIYCVVPRPLADELYPKLVEHYSDDENVTVIVDRREFDRRPRERRNAAADSSRSPPRARGRRSAAAGARVLTLRRQVR